MKKQVIIVAGGNGSRMGTILPKQFIEISGKPILLRTLENFYSFDSKIDIVLVLPSQEIERWENICKTFKCEIKHRIVKGGTTRFESVKNGLKLLIDDALVAVHDGVRPFVSHETLSACFEVAGEKGVAIPSLEMVDSVRIKIGEGSESCDRSQYRVVQTPQVFRSDILKKAYNQPYKYYFTDDASVVENVAPIYLVEGNRENIKITTAFDLQIAEVLLKNQ
ncbi:2-C-methyl-D-erythritol 4-phosphate cytidylyltransferase [bacterium]|nr:2-C-methyl-D-erythritol 4-phosphate cytidylyltransferase [bacterium]